MQGPVGGAGRASAVGSVWDTLAQAPRCSAAPASQVLAVRTATPREEPKK